MVKNNSRDNPPNVEKKSVVEKKEPILKLIKICKDWENQKQNDKRCKICNVPDTTVNGKCLNCSISEVLVIAETQIKGIVYILKKIRHMDKTSYPYYGEESRTPLGTYPQTGTRWATPREMATDLLRELCEDV